MSLFVAPFPFNFAWGQRLVQVLTAAYPTAGKIGMLLDNVGIPRHAVALEGRAGAAIWHDVLGVAADRRLVRRLVEISLADKGISAYHSDLQGLLDEGDRRTLGGSVSPARSDESGPTSLGHAFISYVREDSDVVDRLEGQLVDADIGVWRDVRDLWPGDDWKREIRDAIENDSCAFVACFSANSSTRDASYLWEEMTLAVEGFRRRPPGRRWIYPVRLDNEPVPNVDLGAGRRLTDLHATDFFGDRQDVNARRLASAIKRGMSR